MIAIYGSGGLGAEILDLLLNDLHIMQEDIIFIDDYYKETCRYGISVYSFERAKKVYDTSLKFVIANGEPIHRKKLREIVEENGYNLTSVISSKAYIGMNTIIEKGNIVFPNTYIGCNTILSEGGCVHVGARVESNCTVGKDCFISSGAFVGADTVIGNMVFIGPNSSIKDNLTIEDNVVIGMAANVLNNVQQKRICIGNPGRIMDKTATYIFNNKYS